MQPLVNILIPTFNQAQYVRQTVESALAQDYENLQVIVSDDASTDESQAVLSVFESDARFKLHRNSANLGRVGNYRRCLYELADGDWVLMLDGDDFLDDDTYISTAMASVAENSEIDLVFANARRLREDIAGGLHESPENVGLPEVMDGSDFFLRFANEKVSLFHNTCVYKRAKACALEFYRLDIVSSDWESLLRYILTGKVYFVDANVAVWRLHGANASQGLSSQARIDNLASIVEPYLEARRQSVFSAQILRSWYSARLRRIALHDLRRILKLGDIAGYRRYMAKLKRLDPEIFRQLWMSPDMWFRLGRCYLRKLAGK